MVKELLQVVRPDRVQDIEEILPRRAFVLRVHIWEVGHDLRVLLHIWPESLDRDLIVLGHVDVVDFLLLKELLLTVKHQLEEVLVDGTFIGKVVLH